MINLKVKTLDSQNHDFSVEDDITVRQFKEHIAEKINVAVDMQRLIYCGRVLSDDKALKEYDVNGKVVHLVQRAPPSARGSSSSTSGVGSSSLSDEGARASARRSRSSDNGASRGQIFRGLDDFNTMYFGSMTSIPLNVNATQTPPQIPTVSPSSTLCMNRITVARHMLQCVDNIISYLETPERGLNNTAMDILSQQTMESTVFEVGISAVGDVDIPPNQMQNFVQAFQGAVSAAFRQNGISNVTVQQQQDTLNPSVQVFGTIPDSAIVTPPNTSATATPAQESSGASSGSSSTSSSTSESSADSRRQARPGAGGASGGSSGSGSSRNQTTSTQTLAEVVQQMRVVQRRMEPFLQQYYDILQNDPTYEERDAAIRENAQRVFDRISEALHYMSHAQHAISDLMLDLQTAAPRHLCCRPILVEQSAFVSSGIAAVPNNINLANLLRATHNNNNPEVGNNNINAQIINLSIPGMPGSAPGGPLTMPPLIPVNTQNRPTTGSAAAAGPATGTANTGANAPTTAPAQPQATNASATNASNNNNAQMQMARLIQAVVNAAPIHADIHVQINAGGNPPASGAAATAAASSGSGTAAATTTASSGGAGGPQPNPTMTNNTSTNTNSGGNDGTQSRFATVTLPTTSTQTRSTARPHVHSIPPAHIRQVRPIPANMLSSFDRFDRFLPCNSHHIRENGDRGPETITVRTANNSNSSSSGTTPASGGQPSAPPPESLASLPFNLFGSQFTLADFEQIVPNPNTLNRIRDSLQTYVVQTLFNGEPISEGTMPNAMNALIQQLEPILSLVSRYDLPDYDTRASFENLIRRSVPFCMNLIREDSSQQFGVRLLRFLITFVRRFFMILVVGVGAVNAESFSRELFNIAVFGTPDTSSVAPELLRLFLPAIHRQLDRSGHHDQQEIQEFLVIRSRPPGEQSGGANRGPSPMEVDDTESSTTPELVSDIAEISISIEPPNIVNLDQCAAIVISAGPVTSGSTPSTVRVVAAAPSAAPTTAAPASAPPASRTTTNTNGDDVTMTVPLVVVDPQVPPPLADEEDLPSVAVGSEQWHAHLPQNWLPVITRDIARQRRQNPQGPFTDAYISGMSSKRRKLIAETKPPSDVPSLIADNVREAFHGAAINPASVVPASAVAAAAGGSGVAGGFPSSLSEFSSTIADDAALHSSYCEAMRASVRERLAKDPNYDAKRFPNCSKYFEK
uniref:Large proline-rich protein BAG6 n=1 Tax=Culex pipiens TaxID=7175 RepID=A0A8D8H6X0_CULPI